MRALNKKSIIVLGAGGHAKVTIDLLQCCGYSISGFVSPDRCDKTILGVKRIGDDKTVLNFDPIDVLLVNGTGYMPSSTLRYDLFLKFKSQGYCFQSLSHPHSIVAKDVELGEGVQVMAGAVIQSGSVIGDNVIVNTRVSVDHDVVVRAHCHVAPGVTLCGGVSLGETVFVGAGSTVIQNIAIESSIIVPAGSVIKSHEQCELGLNRQLRQRA